MLYLLNYLPTADTVIFVFKAVVEFQTVLVRLTDVLSIMKLRDHFHRTSIRYTKASKRRPARSKKAEKRLCDEGKFLQLRWFDSSYQVTWTVQN